MRSNRAALETNINNRWSVMGSVTKKGDPVCNQCCEEKDIEPEVVTAVSAPR